MTSFFEALSISESPGDQACMIFECAQVEGLLRSRSIEGFGAVALYAACRIVSLSRTVEGVTAVANADADEFRVAYDAMYRSLGLPTGPVNPAEFLLRFASFLDVPTRIEIRFSAIRTLSFNSHIHI